MSIDTPIEHDTIFIRKKSDKSSASAASSSKKRVTSTVSYKSALNIGETLCKWEEFYKKSIQDWTEEQFGKWTKSYFKFSDKIKNLLRDYAAGKVAEDEYIALIHLKEEAEALLVKRNQRTSRKITTKSVSKSSKKKGERIGVLERGSVSNVTPENNQHEFKRGQWSLEEDNILIEAHNSEFTIEEMSELLGRSPRSIIYRLKVLDAISESQRDKLLESYDDSHNTPVATPKPSSEPQREQKNLRPINTQKYHEYFKHLNRASKFGEKAPHKVILLLSVIDLYEEEEQQSTPQIRRTPQLVNLFKKNWRKYVKSQAWECDISSPWNHMYFEPFWTDGVQSDVASIDEDMHILFKNGAKRDEFRKTLLQQI